MLILGTINTASQTVATGENIDLGAVYRKYCRKNSCGVKTFDTTDSGIVLQQVGIYEVTATFVGTGTVAGNITVQLNQNGVPTTGAIATETITTATTEFRTLPVTYLVIVNNSSVLGQTVVSPVTLSFTNTGVGATFTSAVVDVKKVV